MNLRSSMPGSPREPSLPGRIACRSTSQRVRSGTQPPSVGLRAALLRMSEAVRSLPVTMIKERVCVECSRTFMPSSGHRRCPSCRSKNLCACGQPKQTKSDQCGDCRTEVGEANCNWRGGKVRHQAGYVMIYARGHPRAGSNPYVFEHIL